MKSLVGITAIVAATSIANGAVEAEPNVLESRTQLEMRFDLLRSAFAGDVTVVEQKLAQWGNWGNWNNWANF